MTDDRLEWFPCYPSKLLGALAEMNPREGYVYVVILMRIYECGGSCRDSVAALAIRTGLNKRIVAEALDNLFRCGRLVRGETGITNPIAAQVIEEAKALREHRRRAGAEGGNRASENRKKKQKEKSSDPGPEDDQGNTQLQLQEQDSLLPDGRRVPDEPETDPPGDGWPRDYVEQFWQAFPPYRREGKRKVGDKLARLRRDKVVSWEALIGAVKRFAATSPGEFAPAPIVWLNGERWDREYGNLNGGSTNATNRNGTTGGGFAAIAARVRRDLAERGETLDLRSAPADEPPRRH